MWLRQLQQVACAAARVTVVRRTRQDVIKLAYDWEATLRKWVKPSSDAEETRRDRTEAEIRAALAAYPSLPNAAIRVFVQGSYKNRTNVRLNYDVDIAVEYQEGEPAPTATPRIASSVKSFSARGLSNDDLGLTTIGSFDPSGFKDHVEAAMVDAFGRSKVERSSKCIKIKNGSTTLPADVVPCFPMRRYDSSLDCHRGIRIFPDDGSVIDNFPEQHYTKGCAKNDRTRRRYKRMVRALKRMQMHLLSNGTIDNEIPSFAIECLVYNVDDRFFGADDYVVDFVRVTEQIWYRTYDQERCWDWEEVNGLKYLFRGAPSSLRENASKLTWAAHRTVENS